MAETVQINPRLTAATHAQFVAYCKQHGSKQSDVVEAALLERMQPATEGDGLQLILDKLLVMEQANAALVGVLERIVKHLETQASPSALHLATAPMLYTQMRLMPPVPEEPAPEAVIPETHPWWRWGRW